MAMPGSSTASFLAGVLLLTASLEVSAVSRFLGRDIQEHYNTDVPTFYIYNNPEFTITNHLRNCKEVQTNWSTYIDVVGPLQKQLANHPRRAKSAAEAQWKIVPFDFDINEKSGVCNGTTAAQRVNAALDTLASLPLFKKNGGADHVIIAMRHSIYPHTGEEEKTANYFPNERRHLLRNMVVGHYQDHHLNVDDPVYGFQPEPGVGGWIHAAADWRCTWLLPVKSAEGLWKGDEDFSTWVKRPHPIFFRGHGPKLCRGEGAEALRHSTFRLKGVVPNIIVNDSHADTLQQYRKEITNSKFCLVMRCDDAQTSRLVDAMAAGCIPVLVSEGLDLVAKPFSQLVNYDAFTVSIEEATWMKDTIGSAHFAYDWPDTQLRQMHVALQAERAQLLWKHPQSQTGTMALRQLATCAP